MTKKLSLLFLICFLSALKINAEVYEGSCGDNVRYSLDTSTGVLKITGTGAMTNYGSSSSVPWYSYRSYIKSVDMANGVTSIGDFAYQNCYGLTFINIPQSVTSIGERALANCSSLTSVTIPPNVTSICREVFDGCSGLKSVIIPNGVTYVSGYAFYDCSSLTDVYCYAEKAPSTGSYVFKNVDISNATLYVPSTSISSYKSTSPWSGFGNIVALNNEEPTPTGIAINETNFPDEVFRNYLLRQSYGQDGVLTEEEIAGVKSISVTSTMYSTQRVNTLQGIEFFTALTKLYCTNNQITSLDISKNTKLTYIDCAQNQLTSLDVSNNTELTYLKCSSNKITSLGIAKNTKLTNLLCDFNQLTSLDVSQNTALTELSCSTNKLTSLNVSKKTALQSLQCQLNQLTSLNVSGCTKLTALYCFSNQLTSLNVSGLTALSILSCYSNQIKGAAMDVLVESLPSVSYGTMYVYNSYENELNEMTTTQVAAAKAKGWRPCYDNASDYTGDTPTVEGIVINETNFPDANFRNYLLSQSYGSDGILSDAEIAGITSLKVGGKSIKKLQGIEYFTALIELDCCKSQIDTLDLSHNLALTSLRCYSNKLTSLDLSKNTVLEELQCDNNQLTSLDVSGCKVLKRLYCYNNQLISLDLSKNTALEKLNCLNNKLGYIDVSGCVSLQTVHCYQNQISGKGMDAFVASLPTVIDKALFVIYSNNEGNVMTTAQVAAAKAKGWIPKYYDGKSWQEYAGSEPEVMKCATPIVAFYGGKLIFRCATPDVKYVCKVGNIEFETDGTDVSLPSSITLSVYATKDGYEPSDTITQDIDPRLLLGKIGDVNGDGEVDMSDVMFIVNKILNGKFPDE